VIVIRENIIIKKLRGNNMGGLAIKKVIGREGDRFTREDKDLYKSVIKSIYPNEITFPEEIQSKETFGDLDVLISNEVDKDEFHLSLFRAFNDKEIKVQGFTSNSNVRSYSIGDKQVDFIFTDKWIIPIAYHYYSNNDFGNLLGRIARNLGLKFGHDGLSLVVRRGDHFIKELRLSTDMRDILLFLGFHPWDIEEYFREGLPFKDFETMYRFVIRSKYFDGSKYDLDKLNQINRIRNVKRKTYMEFIDFLDNNPELKGKKPEDVIHKPWIEQLALEVFDKYSEYNRIIFSVERETYGSMKFNGNLVMEWYGLKGKELGQFIATFKRENDFVSFSPSEIRSKADELYRRLYQ